MKFTGLKYGLANEDSRLDRSLLPMHSAKVLSVAGSGSRLVSLAAKAPERTVAVDCSAEQLWLSEVRLALARSLELEDFKAVLGYPTAKSRPMDIRKVLGGQRISAPARDFFIQRSEEAGGPDSRPIYWGKWEKTIKNLSQALRTIIGKNIIAAMKDGHSFRSACEAHGRSGRLRYELALSLFANKTWFSVFMYGKTFPVLNLASSEKVFFENLLDQAFQAAPLAENFFLQLLFLGELTSADALPDEVDPAVYAAAQKALRTATVEFVRSDISNAELWRDDPFDAVFLSDIPSYLTAMALQKQISLIQTSLKPRGFALLRYYRHRPFWHIPTLQPTELDSGDERTGAYHSELIFRDSYMQSSVSATREVIHASMEN